MSKQRQGLLLFAGGDNSWIIWRAFHFRTISTVAISSSLLSIRVMSFHTILWLSISRPRERNSDFAAVSPASGNGIRLRSLPEIPLSQFLGRT